MSQPLDHTQRLAALDPQRSFAVAAPAGSGKTGLLTQRVLTLLATCQQPEEVLAITFTRKAAAEMRHRIIEALRMAANEPMPEADYLRQTWDLAQQVLERDREHNWQLLNAPNRLRIQTIDGLCRDLARQRVLENGLGELPQPSDNADAIYREAVRALLKQLEQDNALAAALATLLRHLDNNLQRIETLLSGLLAKREQWLSLVIGMHGDEARHYLEQQLLEVITSSLSTAEQKLSPIASELALLVDYAATNLANGGSDHPLCQLQGSTSLPPASPDCANLWQAITAILLTADGKWRKTIDVRSGFPAGKGEPQSWKERWKTLITDCQSVSGLQDALTGLRKLPYDSYPENQWQLLEALTTLLPYLSAELSLQFLTSNSCDFTEITLAALKALGDDESPTDTALKLDYQIRHILIDEFQDTASVQFQLLKKLTAGWQPDDGRTLFIVGDGMQSLYGFRSANVGLFLEARQQPIGNIALVPLDLSVNFRSQRNIVEWINTTFTTAFPADDDISRGAVSYSNADAFNAPLSGEAVQVDVIVDSDQRSAEAELVVSKIQQAQQRKADGSIAVLVRNRSHLRDIVPAMYRAGLSWQAVDIEPLAQRMAVVDAHSLTRALLDYSDRIAWLSILRTPWCGLDLTDIHTLVTSELTEHNPVADGEHYPMIWGQLQHHTAVSGLSASAQTTLARITGTLQQTLDQRGRKPLRSWIEGCWLALGGAAGLLDSNDVHHVRRYFDLLEQHSSEAAIDDWDAFNEAVNRLYAAPASDGDAKLQVMTIHKSKGLEFGTVIIPGLDRSGGNSDAEMLLWRERIDQHGNPQLLLGPLQASESESDALFEHLKYEQKQKERLENTRVIYVAATRAVEHLHLIFQAKRDSKGALKAPSDNSLLAPLWPQLASHIAADDGFITLHTDSDLKESQDQSAPALNHMVHLPTDWQLPTITSDEPLANYRGRAEGYVVEGEQESETTTNNATARHTGTVLHQTLQQMVSDGIDAWHTQRIEQQQPFWKAQLRQLGVTEADCSLAIDKLTKAITTLSSDQDGRWLLDSQHTDSACEQAFDHLSNSRNKVRRSIIDRTFVADGVRWVIDYKSSEPAAGQDMDAFIQEESHRYRPQLQRYAQLLKQLSTEPVKTALYFPLLPRLVTVD